MTSGLHGTWPLRMAATCAIAIVSGFYALPASAGPVLPQVRVFGVNTQGTTIPFQILGKDATFIEAGEPTMPMAIFDRAVQPGELIVGDITIATDADRIYWNGDATRLPDNAETGTISTPEDDAGRIEIDFRSRTPTQYFERSEEDTYTLKETDAPDVDLRLELGLLGEDRITVLSERFFVSERKAVDGVNLDVGEPIINSLASSLTLIAPGNDWCTLALTANPYMNDGYVYVLLLRRPPVEAPQEVPIAQFVTESKFVSLPSRPAWPAAQEDSRFTIHKVENCVLTVPPALESIDPEAELLSAPRVITVFSDARMAQLAQGLNTTLFKLVIRNSTPSGGAPGSRGPVFGGGNSVGGASGAQRNMARDSFPLSTVLDDISAYYLEGTVRDATLAALPPGFAIISDTTSEAGDKSLMHGAVALVHARQTGVAGRSLVDFYACYRTEAETKRKKAIKAPRNIWARAVYECNEGDTIALMANDPEGAVNLAVLVTIEKVESRPHSLEGPSNQAPSEDSVAPLP
ncbi:MAG: hypothetical protein HYV27_23205 [Candidatus Hydrogenedentes bacterium]|nr:hypothetical protein [Candidatus Hydrogenedentota bacterium]